MHILITSQEFEKAQSRDLIPLQCGHCKETFEAFKHKIQAARKGRDGLTYDYCSRHCVSVAKGFLVERICQECKTSFLKTRSELKKTKGDFCSRSCAAIYNNAHKTKGTRRSKLEIWLESKLTELYPWLDVHYSRKDAIQSELDIYIPSLKLAFELNGLFHYEPIYGQEKLIRIQNNDKRKYQACLERGIELCIIDTSGLKYFKPQKAEIYLNIITDIIKRNGPDGEIRTRDLHAPKVAVCQADNTSG